MAYTVPAASTDI